MKKIAILIALTFCVAALAAQTGLFRISFGDTLNKADSLLASSGFFAKDVEGTLVKYFPQISGPVESVVLIVDPVTEIVAGWLVRYSSSISQKQDQSLIDRLILMHGEEVLIDPETKQITWVLTPTRTASAAYAQPNNLCIYYRDSELAHLFDVPEYDPGSPE